MSMLESFAYKGAQPGPALLILGAVHGNEKCGTEAIRRVIGDIDKGELKIATGRVTLVPVCNPRAYEKDVRFIERNLNRYLLPTAHPDTYEARLGNELCPLIADCGILLDIHSYTVGGPPFVFIGGTDEKERAFAASLGAAALLSGWEQAYAATGRCKDACDKNEGVGTTEYARRCGAIAATLECGQHKAPDAPLIAYQAIRRALAYLGIAEKPEDAAPSPPPPSITVSHVFYRDGEGLFPKKWKHLEPAAKGTILAMNADKSVIAAPSDGFVIMPRPDCPIGEEWFYFGVGKAA